MADSGDSSLRGELYDLTMSLRLALDRFSLHQRFADFAVREIPDARSRLEHVMTLTAESAHRTMDLVEQSYPLAEQTARRSAEIVPLWRQFRARVISPASFRQMVERLDVFLEGTQEDTDRVRKNLSEILITQGYQDISGQIIHSVMELVGEIEHAIAGLAQLSTDGSMESVRAEAEGSRGYGPVVPGVDHGKSVSDQQDVDALLSGLGM